jgi:hypothetical protein
MTIEYGWKGGTRLRGVDVQAAGEELQRLREAGCLTQKDVLRAARSEKSPLHDAFEWKDSKAAELYRLDQAKYLIRCVVIKRIDGEATPPVRAFVSVTTKEATREYVAAAEARTDPALRQQIIAAKWAALSRLRHEISEFEEFAGVVEAIDELQGRLELAEAA